MRTPEFWSDETTPLSTALSTLLAPLGWAYGFAGRLRAGLTNPHHCEVPVICIGNLVAGGAGKTPVAMDIGRRLTANGQRPHFLSRGYGGILPGPVEVDPARHDARQIGDEALLLARIAPTWVSRDRVAGAIAAVNSGAGIVIMDDGFQNPTLAKDLSLLVVDGAYGFGNGKLLPAGPLREPIKAGLARADGVIVIGPDIKDIARLVGDQVPLLKARLVPHPDAEALKGKDVLAFAGIGRPEKFFKSLEDAGCRLIARDSFADHHPYSRSEIDDLLAKAGAAGAIAVTTTKDVVRLAPDQRGKVTVFEVDLAWEDEAMLTALLDGAIPKTGVGQ